MLGFDGWEHATAYHSMVTGAHEYKQIVWWPGEDGLEGFFARVPLSPGLTQRLLHPATFVRTASLVGFTMAARAAYAENEA